MCTYIYVHVFVDAYENLRARLMFLSFFIHIHVPAFFTYSPTQRHAVKHFNTLQHNATHCNTPGTSEFIHVSFLC